ncbi:MAG: translation initiation factor [Planctomycetota bacterium]|jgi:translation initiation factor 1
MASNKRAPGDRLVYSTSKGRVRSKAAKPAAAPRDGVVRVRPEKQKRGGKTVTTIAGLPGGKKEVAALAKELRQLCGAGGTVKKGVVEVQGDHVDRIIAELTTRGFVVKRSGG